MNWSKVGWFAFFPPLFSIYLLFISSLSKGYLSGQIDKAIKRNILKGHEDFVRNTALGWATQLSFVNAMLASFISTISIWSASQSFKGVALTLIPLVLIFTPMLWYILSHEPDQIVSDKSNWFKRYPATCCKIVLLLVNVMLIVAIAVNQQFAPN